MRPARRRRRAAILLVLLAVLAAVVAGGLLLPAQTGSTAPARVAVVGRTSTVCPGSTDTARAASLTAVAVRQGPDRPGRLTAVPVGAREPAFTITEQGRSERLVAPDRPVVLRGEGALATSSSAAVFGQSESGATAGLAAGTCTPSATAQWFAGVGVEPGYRTDLLLTNPDDAQAVVDLRFFGPDGIVVVPGSPAVVVAARSTRTVALEPLVDAVGPLTVSVRASEGRVSAKALDQVSAGALPAGLDWHDASSPPRRTLVVPAVPEGDGRRELVVTNPGRERATVAVEVLGVQGAFAPAGAEVVEVEAESTATLDLTAGLAGGSGGLRLSGDRPVTAALRATTERSRAQPDLAVLPATAPLVRTGVAAVGTVDGVDSELVLSNAGDTEASVSLEVFNPDGVSLRTDTVLLVPGGTSTRRLTTPGPSSVVVGVPDSSAVHGGVVFTQPEGPVAGLAVLQVASPDVASRAPSLRADPGVAR